MEITTGGKRPRDWGELEANRVADGLPGSVARLEAHGFGDDASGELLPRAACGVAGRPAGAGVGVGSTDGEGEEAEGEREGQEGGQAEEEGEGGDDDCEGDEDLQDLAGGDGVGAEDAYGDGDGAGADAEADVDDDVDADAEDAEEEDEDAVLSPGVGFGGLDVDVGALLGPGGVEEEEEEGEEEGEDGVSAMCDSDEWIRRQKANNVSPEEILAHLGLRVRHAAGPDELWQLVAQLVADFRERMLPRRRLESVSTLDDAVALLSRAERVLVISGAGISVAAGIPDFRSKHGVYQMVEEKFDLPDPQSLFDINYFVDNPVPFFTFAKNLYPGKYLPTTSHCFIKAVEREGKLLRNYTQNIDTLEKVAGIERKVTCHGSFETASCLACKHQVPCDRIHPDIVAARVPRCSECCHPLNILKPDIVFFGEPLGEGFERRIQEDLPQCDLLLVMGSSMRVQPVATIPSMLPREVPQILINRELVMQPHQFDVELLGDCDAITAELSRRLGWALPPVPGVEPATSCDAPCGAPAAQTAPAVIDFCMPNRYLFPGAVPPLDPIDDENEAEPEADAARAEAGLGGDVAAAHATDRGSGSPAAGALAVTAAAADGQAPAPPGFACPATDGEAELVGTAGGGVPPQARSGEPMARQTPRVTAVQAQVGVASATVRVGMATPAELPA